MAKFVKGNSFWKKRKSSNSQITDADVFSCDVQIGTIKQRRDGYKIIKIANGNKGWSLLQREVFKEAYGRYPEKLEFIDGDRGNCDLCNLREIKRGDVIRKNSVHNKPKEVKELIFLKANLTRAINEQHRKIKNDTV